MVVARLLGNSSPTPSIEHRLHRGATDGPKRARPLYQRPNSGTFKSASREERYLRIVSRNSHTDLSIGGGNSALGCCNIRSPLQKLRGQTQRNLWRSRRKGRRWN